MIAHIIRTEKKTEEKPIHFMDLQAGQMVSGANDTRLKISANQYLYRTKDGFIQAQQRQDWPPLGVKGTAQTVKMIWEIE